PGSAPLRPADDRPACSSRSIFSSATTSRRVYRGSNVQTHEIPTHKRGHQPGCQCGARNPDMCPACGHSFRTHGEKGCLLTSRVGKAMNVRGCKQSASCEHLTSISS